MKIFLTIELIALLVVIFGEWQFWTNTYNWRSDDGGYSHTYSYKIKNHEIKRHCLTLGCVISIVGFLFLIWA